MNLPCRRRSLLALLAGAPLLARAQSRAGEILLGSSAAFSGPAALLGQRYHAGAQALFDQVNRGGGIAGARIRVLRRDDSYEPERAEAHTRELSQDSSLVALFGYVGTPTSRVALAYARRARLPFVAPFTGADFLRDPAQVQVFNVRAGYREEGQVLVRAMRAAKVRRLNVLYQADLYGRAGLEAIRAAVAPAGIELGAVATVKRNSTEVAAAVQALVGRNPADAIFMASTYDSCAAFVREAREAGFRGPFYGLSFTGMEPLRQALGRQMQGVTLSQVVPDAHDASLPVVAAYQRAMTEAGDRQFDSISLEGYLSARVLVEALRRAPAPVTREGLQQALEQLGDLDLGGFALRYGPGAHQGSDFVTLQAGR
ncbi:ABC transporter substrate-binding protein [Pelomonas sp. CA6]|uniref:ABC transporter substrate-binding protein n=1 Tax=Pelomonas sp. CA6 TaxID=2907999 RepID=UPI001F4B1BBA|nr:ABC transporter substrate-binding protein [Pelomonas sp. CA6]MCH7342891.1 ABC transporter substrate-binding protein [Pelomonas sp. CA6]